MSIENENSVYSEDTKDTKDTKFDIMTPEGREFMLDFKINVMNDMDSFYQAEVARLEIEKLKVEAELKETKHKTNWIIGGLLVIILAIITSLTVIFSTMTFEIIDTTTVTSESYGDLEFGDSVRFKSAGINIGSNNNLSLDEDKIGGINENTSCQ